MVSWLMKNRIIIEPKYEEAEGFLEGLAAVCKGKMGFYWGVINKIGAEITPYCLSRSRKF